VCHPIAKKKRREGALNTCNEINKIEFWLLGDIYDFLEGRYGRPRRKSEEL
jgi:hypothetical protein